MGTDLNKYLTGRNLQTFQKFGMDRLAQGVNLKYKNTIYRVECVEIKEIQGESVEVLASRIYSEIAMSINIFSLDSMNRQNTLSKIDTTDEANKSLPLHTTILDRGSIVDSNEIPAFQREMTDSETEILNHLMFEKPNTEKKNKEKDIEPDTNKKDPVEKEKSEKTEKDKPLSQWSKREKAMVFLAGFVALSAIAYGAHRKGILPSRKDIGEFLSQKKASLSEMSQSWRKKPEETAYTISEK